MASFTKDEEVKLNNNIALMRGKLNSYVGFMVDNEYGMDNLTNIDDPDYHINLVKKIQEKIDLAISISNSDVFKQLIENNNEIKTIMRQRYDREHESIETKKKSYE